MNCASCGRANRAAARFCGGCGKALAARCPACGAECEPDAQFCDGCGTSLVARAGEAAGVRKVVTIVFADLGRTSGTLAQGGEFESVFVRLLLFGDDRIVSMELFEPGDLDLARARFAELRPSPRL